jgi:ribosomal protein L24
MNTTHSDCINPEVWEDDRVIITAGRYAGRTGHVLHRTTTKVEVHFSGLNIVTVGAEKVRHLESNYR